MSQDDYLLVLFDTCEFTINSRYVWLSEMFKRRIDFITQLSIEEKDQAIHRLKNIRKQRKDKH